MLTFALQSGSNGNCIYVETEDARLLFDAGISGRGAQQRLAQRGRDIREIDALVISHNHSDHTSGAGVVQRKFGLPIYATAGTWRRCQSQVGEVSDVRHFDSGQSLQFGQTIVHTVPTPHDGVDGVAFVVEARGRRLGIFTDLGHRFRGIEAWIESLDGLYLESNYDPHMLANGHYPTWLKNRVAGLGGHLSNDEAARLVADCAGRLQFWILAHLSANNNCPNLALQTAQRIVGSGLPLTVAPRTGLSDSFQLA